MACAPQNQTWSSLASAYTSILTTTHQLLHGGEATFSLWSTLNRKFLVFYVFQTEHMHSTYYSTNVSVIAKHPYSTNTKTETCQEVRQGRHDPLSQKCLEHWIPFPSSGARQLNRVPNVTIHKSTHMTKCIIRRCCYTSNSFSIHESTVNTICDIMSIYLMDQNWITFKTSKNDRTSLH